MTKAIPKTKRILKAKSTYSLALMTLALPLGVNPSKVLTNVGNATQAIAQPAKNMGTAVKRKNRVNFFSRRLSAGVMKA